MPSGIGRVVVSIDSCGRVNQSTRNGITSARTRCGLDLQNIGQIGRIKLVWKNNSGKRSACPTTPMSPGENL